MEEDRKLLDKYYTNNDVAYRLAMTTLLALGEDCYYIDPSCGAGAFSIDFVNVVMDIEPELCGALKQDYLTYSPPELDCPLVVLGNPPFGKRASLAKSFIKHSIEIGAEGIAFILPSTFKKHTLQSVFPLEWKLCYSEDLPENSFSFGGDPYSIPCVFQIWTTRNVTDLREKKRTAFKNEHFEIVKSGGDIFVMGAAPRNIKYPNEVTENNRGYWLKCINKADVVAYNIVQVPWKGNSSASGGVSWLTKQEFINQYEQYHKIGEYK